MDFIAALESKPTSNFCAVGIDADGPDWTSLWERLNSISDSGCACDYSNYDGSIPAELMEGVIDVVNAWYTFHGTNTPEDMRVRRVVFEEIIHCNMGSINSVYQKHKGNPSGFFMTTISNTVVGELYLRYAWRSLAPPDLITKYDEFVRSFIYGDDNILSIALEVQSWFNQSSISNLMLSHGIICTTADKKEIVGTGIEPLSSLTFLKRGFRPHPKLPRYQLAPIDITTITELPNWLKKNHDHNQLLEQNHECLKFAYHRGSEFFKLIKKKISDECAKVGCYQSIPTINYADCDRTFLSKFSLYPQTSKVSVISNIKGRELRSVTHVTPRGSETAPNSTVRTLKHLFTTPLCK